MLVMTNGIAYVYMCIHVILVVIDYWLRYNNVAIYISII